jgi:sortase (surface protein transpeptidase)
VPAGRADRRTRIGRALVAVAVVLAGAGALTFAVAGPPGQPRRTPGVPVPVAAAPVAAPEGSRPAPVLDRSVPVTLDVPAIGVHAPVAATGLNADGTIEVPPLGSGLAGWYEHSPTPGERGPAVVLGHVDSARSGPGVFFDLPALLPGDIVAVTRADGSTARFRVDRVAEYPKSAFPTAAVYGDLDHAGLRLITCGGAFDPVERSYESNVIVYASAVAGRAR